MMIRILMIIVPVFYCYDLFAREVDISTLANRFTRLLTKEQQLQVVYPFESGERYNFHFVPKTDRKGISLNELNKAQQVAAFRLLGACLSQEGLEKTVAIIELEKVLKVLERRTETDHYRDTGKYFILIFGEPAPGNLWGWRFEGHHISYNFSAKNNALVSGTPSFIGSNPAIVRDGEAKGKQVLKQEANLAFSLLGTLTETQLAKAVLTIPVPNDILSFIQRYPKLENNQGLPYSEMDALQKEKLRALINVYVHRYTKLFADKMLKEIQSAGLNELRFVWIGPTTAEPGKAHYYRIQGPTLLIEYDNSQNNANHVHTVLRDLKNDFAENLLTEHYKKEH